MKFDGNQASNSDVILPFVRQSLQMCEIIEIFASKQEVVENASREIHKSTILYALCVVQWQYKCKAEFLDETQTKVLRGFLLAIHSHLCSFALRFLFLQTHATS